MNNDIIALSLLAGSENAHAFSSFLPSTFTVKSFALDKSDGRVEQKVADLRAGYRPAVAFGLMLGAAVSAVAQSWMPLAASAGASVVMLLLYERNLPPEMRLDPFRALINDGAPQSAALQLAACPRLHANGGYY